MDSQMNAQSKYQINEARASARRVTRAFSKARRSFSKGSDEDSYGSDVEFNETLAVAMTKIKKKMGKKVGTRIEIEDGESVELIRRKKVTKEELGSVSRRRNEVALGKRPVESVDEGGDVDGEEEDMDVDSPVQRVAIKKRGSKKKQASERKFYEMFSGMLFSGTRYAHEDTMRELGIFEDVQMLFKECGLETFMSYHLEGYKDETCQLLATLSVHHFDEDPEVEADDGYGFIRFAINGKEFILTLAEMDTLFGFPHGGGDSEGFDKEELQALWKLIGDSNMYTSARSKSAQIKHPAIRYFHKALANTFFARKVSGNINESEIQFLDMALTPLLRNKRTKWNFQGPSEGVSLSYLLVTHLINLKTWAAKMNTMGVRGELALGGIITPILQACGVDIETTQPSEILWLDIPYLTRTKYLHNKRPNGTYLYKFTHPKLGASMITLPCPDYSSLEIGYNIKFDPPRASLYDPQAQPEEVEEAPEREPRPDRYYFEEGSSTLKDASKKMGLLRRWNKWQDKVIKNLRGTVRELASSVKDMAGQIKDLQRKKSSSPLPSMEPPILRRSGSLNNIAPRRAEEAEPARASSFETRHYKRRVPRLVLPTRFEDRSFEDPSLGQPYSATETEWQSLGNPHSTNEPELAPLGVHYSTTEPECTSLGQPSSSCPPRVDAPPPNYNEESMNDFLTNFINRP